jgi:hypothetical protein
MEKESKLEFDPRLNADQPVENEMKEPLPAAVNIVDFVAGKLISFVLY